MHVIPAIDLLDGKVVRLKKGAYDDVTVYPLSPVDQALVYRDAGFARLHIVDLNGAKEGRFVNLPLITEIARKTGMEVQTGGGIRSGQDIDRLLDAGLHRVVVSSMAVKSPDDWMDALHTHGGNRCILGMDLKGGKVAYSGWLETSNISIEDFLYPMIRAGLTEILCTDVSRDGMLSGPNVDLYEDLMSRFPAVRFIASGGVSNVGDLQELAGIGVHSCVVGRAYYEGHVSLAEMAAFR
jgi:phosphoribosylformimino-5-aminoimidazole carboxamide ribotide isomerase